MNRDSVSIDALALEELQWLSSCITVGYHEPSTPPRTTRNRVPVSCPPNIQSFSASISKRKRDASLDSARRSAYVRHATFDFAGPHVKGLYDSTDSETERRDLLGPLRAQRVASTGQSTRSVRSGLSSTRSNSSARQTTGPSPKDGFNGVGVSRERLEVVSESPRDNAWRPKSPQPEVSRVAQSEIPHTSSSLPTRSPISARRQSGYFDFSGEPPSPRSSLRGRRKVRSVDQHSLPPSWTAMLRPKSKSQRSAASLKGSPSQSLSIKVAPAVSFLKSSPIPSSREPSLVSDGSESGHSSGFDIGPATPPLPVPRFPAAEEDVFGRSSPTWLPDEISIARSYSSCSAARPTASRKNSSTSSATVSPGGRDGSVTPTGSSKSVKFAERPTVYHPTTLKWDKALLSKEPMPMDGIDVGSMELDEDQDQGIGRIVVDPVPLFDSPSNSSCGDSGISMGDDTMPAGPVADSRSSSPALSVTPSTIAGSYITGFTFLSSKKKKEVKTNDISGPFTLGAGKVSSRPPTPTSSRPPTPTIRSPTPVSRPSTPSNSRSVTPVSTPARRSGRLVKQRSTIDNRSSVYPSSLTAPLPNHVIGSTASFRSGRSIDADAKSFKSVRSVPSSSQGRRKSVFGARKWWNRFGVAPGAPPVSVS